VESRRLRWAGHVAGSGWKNLFVFAEKSLKSYTWKTETEVEDNIRLGLRRQFVRFNGDGSVLG